MQTRPQISSVLIKAAINHQDRWERALALGRRVRKMCERVSAWALVASLWTQSSCRNILNCPFTDRGAFSSLPVTKRSILQHQRCQPPLCERTIRRRVRWPGWTMLEMTFLASVCLPLSLTFSVYDCWCRGGQRSKRMPTTPLTTPSTPLPTCRCAIHSFSRLWTIWQTDCLLFWSPLPDKTVVFFRCAISVMCKLMCVHSLTLFSHWWCTNILFTCGGKKSGFKIDASRWLHK